MHMPRTCMYIFHPDLQLGYAKLDFENFFEPPKTRLLTMKCQLQLCVESVWTNTRFVREIDDWADIPLAHNARLVPLNPCMDLVTPKCAAQRQVRRAFRESIPVAETPKALPTDMASRVITERRYVNWRASLARA